MSSNSASIHLRLRIDSLALPDDFLNLCLKCISCMRSILPCHWMLNMAHKLIMARLGNQTSCLLQVSPPGNRLWDRDCVREMDSRVPSGTSLKGSEGTGLGRERSWIAIHMQPGPQLILEVLELRGPSELSLIEASIPPFHLPALVLGRECDPGLDS